LQAFGERVREHTDRLAFHVAHLGVSSLRETGASSEIDRRQVRSPDASTENQGPTIQNFIGDSQARLEIIPVVLERAARLSAHSGE